MMMMMMMIGRWRLATNPMDRTGYFSCFCFFFVYVFAKLPTLSLLTSSSAEPTMFDFMFLFILGFFLMRQSSRTTPGALGRQALKAPFSAVLLRFQSLILNLFLHFFFFLNNDTANIIEKKKKELRGSSHWTVAILAPGWPRRRVNQGLSGPCCVLRAALLPSARSPLYLRSHRPPPLPSPTATYQHLSQRRNHFHRWKRWKLASQ